MSGSGVDRQRAASAARPGRIRRLLQCVASPSGVGPTGAVRIGSDGPVQPDRPDHRAAGARGPASCVSPCSLMVGWSCCALQPGTDCCPASRPSRSHRRTVAAVTPRASAASSSVKGPSRSSRGRVCGAAGIRFFPRKEVTASLAKASPRPLRRPWRLRIRAICVSSNSWASVRTSSMVSSGVAVARPPGREAGHVPVGEGAALPHDPRLIRFGCRAQRSTSRRTSASLRTVGRRFVQEQHALMREDHLAEMPRAAPATSPAGETV